MKRKEKFLEEIYKLENSVSIQREVKTDFFKNEFEFSENVRRNQIHKEYLKQYCNLFVDICRKNEIGNTYIVYSQLNKIWEEVSKKFPESFESNVSVQTLTGVITETKWSVYLKATADYAKKLVM